MVQPLRDGPVSPSCRRPSVRDAMGERLGGFSLTFTLPQRGVPASLHVGLDVTFEGTIMKPFSILTVCSANRCRSPMAEALLAKAILEVQPHDFTVTSAGFGPPGAPAEPEVVEVMADIGFDVTRHRSTTVNTSLLAEADLVLAMTRQHVMELALLDEAAWPKTFLIGEFASLATASDGPGRSASNELTDPASDPGDELRQRVARLHLGRRRADLLSLPSALEVSDPIGGPLRGYRATRDRIAGLSEVIARYLAP